MFHPVQVVVDPVIHMDRFDAPQEVGVPHGRQVRGQGIDGPGGTARRQRGRGMAADRVAGKGPAAGMIGHQAGRVGQVLAHLLFAPGCALSLNIWSDVKVFDETIFDFLDKLTTNIMLPLGGLLICIFVGWVMDRAIVRKEVDIDHPTIYKVWFFLVRFVSPVGVAVVMFNKLMG